MFDFPCETCTSWCQHCNKICEAFARWADYIELPESRADALMAMIYPEINANRAEEFRVINKAMEGYKEWWFIKFG